MFCFIDVTTIWFVTLVSAALGRLHGHQYDPGWFTGSVKVRLLLECTYSYFFQTQTKPHLMNESIKTYEKIDFGSVRSVDALLDNYWQGFNCDHFRVSVWHQDCCGGTLTNALGRRSIE